MSVNVEYPKFHFRTDGGWVDGVTGDETPKLGFPTAATVGVDALPGWTPTVTVGYEAYRSAGHYLILEHNATFTDWRFDGIDVTVDAPGVTFRRCEFRSALHEVWDVDNVPTGEFVYAGGRVDNNYGHRIGSRMLLEDCTLRFSPAGAGPGASVLGTNGFTARRCALVDVTEGVRTGYSAGIPPPDTVEPWDGPAHDFTVRLYDCYIRITGPAGCTDEQGIDYHGDGIQCFDAGFGGVPIKIRNISVKSVDQFTPSDDPAVDDPGCGGTSCMIVGTGQSQPVDIDTMLCSGAGFSFQIGCGGDVNHVYIEDHAWVFGPTQIEWATIGDWDCLTCTVDAAGQPDVLVGRIPRGYPGFGPLLPPDTPPT